MAVQGGLLTGFLVRRKEQRAETWRWSDATWPVMGFLVAKFVAYMLLGAGLGWLGARMQLPDTARLWLQAIAAVIVIIAGIRIWRPSFLPWLNPAAPAWARRLVRRSSRMESMMAPAILGFLTILIPCGTTQAMEVAAISSGNAATGAAILGAFVIGTAPLFLLVGIISRGINLFQHRLAWIAAVVVIFVGLSSLNGVLVQIDSPLSAQNQLAAWRWALHGDDSASNGQLASTTPVINVEPNGYTPNDVEVPAGKLINITLHTADNAGCTSVFRIPKLAISKTLPATGDTVVTATFTRGRYTFTCGMGMYTGTINAV
jgi:sulfite exporter TauE/SafE